MKETTMKKYVIINSVIYFIFMGYMYIRTVFFSNSLESAHISETLPLVLAFAFCTIMIVPNIILVFYKLFSTKIQPKTLDFLLLILVFTYLYTYLFITTYDWLTD